MASHQTHVDVLCFGCGCLCDDLRVTVDGESALAEGLSCSLGREWLDRVAAWRPGPCVIEGREAPLAEAVARAADLLSAAHAPLVCGLAGAGTDAQRAAVGIADRLGGFVDWTTTPADAAAIESMQTVGAVGVSLGEIAQRADLVVFWQCDPASTHPRHFERYSLQPKSRWLPRGRADRKVVAVGDPASATAAEADSVVELPAGGAVDALVALRAALAGVTLASDPPAPIARLAEQIRDASFAVFFYGDELKRQGAAALTELTLLAQSQQETTRVVTAPLGGAGNAPGAKSVMTWQTGYPMAVSFASGSPEYGAPDFTAESLLARGEVDAVLVVSEDGMAGLSDAAIQAVSRVDSVVLSSAPVDGLGATVRFSTPPLGAAPGGAVFRSDHVALPLHQPLVDAATTDAGVLAAIAARLAPAFSGLPAGP
ncbi:Formyltransferase/hydrolase complex Fhc subunit B [Posidoniimonas corsicana]|uniref:Formyltransferase/hydrolase complex Fhc subunit B n=1 Tax=Posidoniimonas corsicana TaxID=1938618 RepID=A0A5C5UUY5_9BACT|nr:hypothetical protein [Posidoniimonas corsicana]TWT29360.1 Formyltransferase/hydrolase complex Fhc subunit B [Posidoniimonas corsicana]